MYYSETDIDAIIMVKPPYRILENIQSDQEDTLFCSLEAEQDSVFEIGALGSAEAGRHLAILGSIALAEFGNYKAPNYYLATHASLISPDHYYTDSRHYRLQATVVSHLKRKGIIQGSILDKAGNIIYTGTVEYLPMRPAVFERLNKQSYIDEPEANGKSVSPYITIRPLESIVLGKETCSATYPHVLPEECLGHFKNYPTLPVAILGQLLAQLSIQHFNFLADSTYQKYQVINAEINSYKLAFHGENLKFRSKLLNNEKLIFSEVVSADSGTLFADLKIKIVGCR